MKAGDRVCVVFVSACQADQTQDMLGMEGVIEGEVDYGPLQTLTPKPELWVTLADGRRVSMFKSQLGPVGSPPRKKANINWHGQGARWGEAH